jgi:Ca2+-binding RTX toxin-like protein
LAEFTFTAYEDKISMRESGAYWNNFIGSDTLSVILSGGSSVFNGTASAFFDVNGSSTIQYIRISYRTEGGVAHVSEIAYSADRIQQLGEVTIRGLDVAVPEADLLAGKWAVSLNLGDDAFYASPQGGTLYAGSGADGVWGSGGADWLFGEAGADQLAGGAGNDRISGGPGRDVISWSSGRDVLSGGPGQDEFLLFYPANEPEAFARITDFRPGADTLNLSNISGLDRGDWIGAARFSGSKEEIRMCQGALEFDRDGDGRADLTIKINTVLTPGDILF